MTGPKEQERRKGEFDPQTLEDGKAVADQAQSSKRTNPDSDGQSEKTAAGGKTRQNPGGRRSGSDSNASRRTSG